MGLKNTADLFGYYEHLIFLLYNFKKKKYKKRAADIGSNLGLHSLIMSILGYSVDSYEPDPEHYKIQKKIIKINKFKNIKIIKKGVYNMSCKQNLIRVVDANFVSVRKRVMEKWRKLKLIWVILKIIKNYDLVKIDAEGSEAKIIKNINKKFIEYWFIVEVSGKQNAKNIFNYCKNNVNIFHIKIIEKVEILKKYQFIILRLIIIKIKTF